MNTDTIHHDCGAGRQRRGLAGSGAGRDGFTAIAMVLALSGIVLVLGLTGSASGSATRNTMERIHARRVRDLIAASAFEMASAVIESQVKPAAPAIVGTTRDLSQEARWPSGAVLTETYEMDLKSLAGEAAAEGVQFRGPILARCSRFNCQPRGTGPSGEPMLREFGLIELAVRIKVAIGSTSSCWRVTVRRFISARPGDDGQLRLRILPTDLASATVEDK